MKPIVGSDTAARRFIGKSGIAEKFPARVVRMLIAFMIGFSAKGFRGRMVDAADAVGCHRTTVSRFLNDEDWHHEDLRKIIKAIVYDYMVRLAKETGLHLEIIFDDTTCVKSLPDADAENPIEGARHLYSHYDKKVVYCHQVVAVMLRVGDVCLNYDCMFYDKKAQSKIEYIVKIANELPMAEVKCYALADSWYSCKAIINAFKAKGYQYIGGFAANRAVFRSHKGKNRNKIRLLVREALRKQDFDLVTIESGKYYVCRVEGTISGVRGKTAVLISVPADGGFIGDAPDPEKARSFVCTDASLSAAEILEIYHDRWAIETFFEQMKGILGFDNYQIRKLQGIKRFWLLTSLYHCMCCVGLDGRMPFGDGSRLLRDINRRKEIEQICRFAQSGMPYNEICDIFA
jgi:hypothetical protein